MKKYTPLIVCLFTMYVGGAMEEIVASESSVLDGEQVDNNGAVVLGEGRRVAFSNKATPPCVIRVFADRRVPPAPTFGAQYSVHWSPTGQYGVMQLQTEVLVVETGKEERSLTLTLWFDTADPTPEEYAQQMAKAYRELGIKCAESDFISFFEDSALFPVQQLEAAVANFASTSEANITVQLSTKR